MSMEGFSFAQNITKIFMDRGRVWTTIYTPILNSERVLYSFEGCLLDLNLYPDILNCIEENVFLCYRYQEQKNRWRAYLEQSFIDAGVLKHTLLFAGTAESLEAALEVLNEECRGKKIERVRK